jgi:serine protease Do
MLQLELRRLRLHVLAGAFFVGAMAALVPVAPALAQGPGAVRGLPDFTDLVEQVGPSVVNIRTLEKSRGNGNAGSPGDEDMQEFFRRFFRTCRCPTCRARHRARISRRRKSASARAAWARVSS